MVNLNKEYIEKEVLYKGQKKYFKTPKGRIALRRAKERQLIKKMPTLYCKKCDETEFEVLTIVDGITLCYNCKYRRLKVLEECEICQ
ncbi:MAG: hypothetical protein ACR2NW_09230 [Thermodesulfobacteriota bacterium]